MLAHSKKEAETVLVKPRKYHLNHDAFGYNLTINAKEATKIVIKVFIRHKYDLHDTELSLNENNFDYSYEIDNFLADCKYTTAFKNNWFNCCSIFLRHNTHECFLPTVKAGENFIDRDHFHFASNDNESTEEYYNRVVKALESGSEFKYQKQIYSFPSRLLLPKGKPGGMPMNMFFYVAPVIGEPRHYNSRIFGEVTLDNRPFGFLLDRPVVHHDFNAPNMVLKEVPIYHRNH